MTSLVFNLSKLPIYFMLCLIHSFTSNGLLPNQNGYNFRSIVVLKGLNFLVHGYLSACMSNCIFICLWFTYGDICVFNLSCCCQALIILDTKIS